MSIRIGIVSSILHPKYGGPAAVVRSHVRVLSDHARVRVLGVAREDEGDAIRRDFRDAELCAGTFPRRWSAARGLQQALQRLAYESDVLHVHMVWDYAVWAAAHAVRRAGKPLIITPHGSVSEPRRYDALHKRIYRRLFLGEVLRNTTYVHALTARERDGCEAFGIAAPTRVIPNGVPAADFDLGRDAASAEQAWPQIRGRRIMLYLGRLWSEKGLDLLPDVWAAASTLQPEANWLLVIAGPDYRDYRRVLEQRIAALGIGSRVTLLGPVTGSVKDSLLAAAECLILPSHGEAFSVAIVEAMAAGLPVIYTDACNFPELAAAGGGWEVPAALAPLTAALVSVLRADRCTLASAGERGRLLGRRRYTLESVGQELMTMYHDAIRADHANGRLHREHARPGQDRKAWSGAGAGSVVATTGGGTSP